MSAVPPAGVDVLQPASTPDRASATEQASTAGRERIIQVCSSPARVGPGTVLPAILFWIRSPAARGSFPAREVVLRYWGTKPGITWVFAGQQIPAYPDSDLGGRET